MRVQHFILNSDFGALYEGYYAETTLSMSGVAQPSAEITITKDIPVKAGAYMCMPSVTLEGNVVTMPIAARYLSMRGGYDNTSYVSYYYSIKKKNPTTYTVTVTCKNWSDTKERDYELDVVVRLHLFTSPM